MADRVSAGQIGRRSSKKETKHNSTERNITEPNETEHNSTQREYATNGTGIVYGYIPVINTST